MSYPADEVERLRRDRVALVDALDDLCDYAERFWDAGEHLYQTRVARTLVTRIKAEPGWDNDR